MFFFRLFARNLDPGDQGLLVNDVAQSWLASRGEDSRNLLEDHAPRGERAVGESSRGVFSASSAVKRRPTGPRLNAT